LAKCPQQEFIQSVSQQSIGKLFSMSAAMRTVASSTHENIPDAFLGSAPGLEIVGSGACRAPPSVGGQSKRSVATALSEKGLEGVPIAEKHVSKKTGEPYWRFRNSAGKGYYIKKADVERLGFAWYPNSQDPTRGALKNPKTGCFVSHEHARTVVGSFAGSDVGDLRDVQDPADELSDIDEEELKEQEEEEEEEEGPGVKSICTTGTSWLIKASLVTALAALALQVYC
jgi:hypothetical protein